ncbi:MAG TPA: hypothetical protein VF613_01690 [Longimicrobium sp.]|jgi:hypothetical protein
MKRALLALLLAGSAQAQTRAGVSPREVTVGERVTSVVETPVAAGERLEVSFPWADTARVWSIRPVRIEAGPGTARATATLVVWSPGPASSFAARGRIVTADGTARPLLLRFPVPTVRSVLPADTSKLKPKPPKDVIGPDREIDWRMVALGALAAVWLLVLMAWLRRRRNRPRPEPIVAPPDARAQALEALEAARARGAVDGRAFYTLVSDALRGFAHAIRPRWSPDLTTTELERRMEKDGVAARDLGPLRSVLHTADLAKFGRYPVPPDTALRDWDEARRWVESFGREESERRETGR